MTDHECPLCELLGQAADDPWATAEADTGDHAALWAVATPAEHEQLAAAAAEHSESARAVKTAMEAHNELHKRFDAELGNPIIERRKAADREARLGETRERLHHLLSQAG